MAATTVSTTASLIVTVGAGDFINVKNSGPATVYVGNSAAVTADQASTGGYPLEPGESLINPAFSASYTVYGITAEGSATVATF